jgi:hypothetical protein
MVVFCVALTATTVTLALFPTAAKTMARAVTTTKATMMAMSPPRFPQAMTVLIASSRA